MAKLTTNTISGGYASTTELNDNFDLVEAAVENTLSRDGTTPNSMAAQLDMDSNRVINVGQPVDDNDAARKKDVDLAISTSLPDQTGNANKALTSNGTTATWQFDNAQYVVNTPAGDIAATTVQAAIDELDTDKVPRTATTGSAKLPTGTTAQRDGAPSAGWIRFNSEYAVSEVYNGTSWTGLGGATGAGGDDIFYENGQTVTTNYTITAGKNAMSAGPITINTGVTVTVGTGDTWTVV